jgi:cell division protein FtsL
MILSIGLLIIESPRLKPEENSVFHEEDIQYKGGKQRRKTTKKSTGIWGKIKKIVLLIVAIFGLISSVITIYRECYPYENKQLEQVKDEIEILNKKIEKLEEINNPVVEISKDTIQ